MRTRVTTALVLVAATAIVALYVWGLPAPPPIADPVFKGKRASDWAKAQVEQGNNWEGQQALKQIGSPATPFLVHYLDRRDSIFNTAYVKLWPHLPGFVQARLPRALLARDLRMNAVAALRDMGPAAQAAVPALIERLADKDGHISLHSAIALGNIGPPAQAAVPMLRPWLRSKKHTVRVYTANALWKIEHNAAEVLPVLEAGLQEEKAPFRWAAAVFLGEMESAATEAIPLLKQAIKSTDKDTASCAVQALAGISPATVPILVETLGDPDPGMRISACVALGKLGPKAKQAVPAVRALMTDQGLGSPTIMGRALGNTKVDDEAAAALSRMQSPAGE